MAKSVVVAVLLATLFSGALTFNLARVLTSVPEEERIDFLKYHSEKGYQLETFGQPVDYEKDLPDEFSLEVYRALLPKSVDNPIILNALACIVCWPNGKCVDLCDPGVHPL
ncbi:uncharacterized protein LOC135131454 isoform X1 [Zophobas morio]|uniref:uncharacterized protein LOC135131454 isoform X1 n=1 Tax=Zophobas morio TaxID=2755281 RepID=UPI003083E49F